MKKSIVALGLLATFVLPNYSVAAENKAYARVLAKDVANMLAPMLPMETNNLYSLHAVAAIDTTLALSARWNFSKDDLFSSLKEEGVTLSKFEKEQLVEAKTIICSTPSLRKFVDAGGTMKYTFYYNDGVFQNKMDISSCK